MIRVNVLGRACGAALLLLLVVVAYRLHNLASGLERDMQMRQVARDMLREEQLGGRPIGREIDDSRATPEPAAIPRPDAGAAAAAHAAMGASQSHSSAGGRWAELEELHRDWAFWVVNLDKRPDRLACAMQEFNRLGVRVNRLRGIDGTLLDLEQLSFVSPELRPEAVRAQFCRRAALGLTACPMRTLHQPAHTG